jgi:protocatechuate 3,4-dioxygenase beta subunit
MSDQKDSRRQFIKNASLASLAFSLSPLASTAKTENRKSVDACEKTTSDYYGEGPFYTDNPPSLTDGKLATAAEAGTKIRITGRVQNLDCSEFIPDTVVDVWQANDAGSYDNSGFNLRGQVVSNAQGFYSFETIQPGKYLNGSKFRPSHIHFKITPPGFPTITTQLYFAGDTSIADDAAAKITSGQFDATHRIIALTADGNGLLEGTWDIAVDSKGIMGVGELHLDKGIIYTVTPNPFTTSIQINYGVFKAAEVSLLVFDMQGRQIASLEQRQLTPEKYNAAWTPDAQLPNGQYYIALKINELQVHYVKVQYNRASNTYGQ